MPGEAGQSKWGLWQRKLKVVSCETSLGLATLCRNGKAEWTHVGFVVWYTVSTF